MRLFFSCLFFFATMVASSAHALTSVPHVQDHARLRLVAGGMQGPVLQAGLELQLEPGWHSYWRMPGEGGLAPEFDWTKSKNLKSVVMQWPLPKRYDTMGLYSFGYDGTVLFPLDIVLEEPARAAVLTLSAEIMICETICIPLHFNLSLDIPGKLADDAEALARITAAKKTVPLATETNALRIDSAVLGPKAIVVRAWSQQGFDNADLFVEIDKGPFYIVAPPKIDVDPQDRRIATMTLTPPEGSGDLAAQIINHGVTFTLTHGGKAIEKKIAF